MTEDAIISYDTPIQLELFKGVPESYSNTIEIFDAIPKWEGRTRKTSLVETSTRVFKLKHKYTGEEVAYSAEIVPAVLGKEDKVKYAYFPGCKEEVVESTLRKLFIERYRSCFEDKYSIQEIKNELAKSGHTYSYYQIMEALEILAETRIRIKRTLDNESLDCSGESIISFVRNKYDNDKEGDRTYLSISFHSLVRQAIEQELFHAYPYAIEMQLRYQLDRWFLRRFYNSFRNASHQKTYFCLSLKNTIVTEAPLKAGTELRKVMALVDASLTRLEKQGVLSKHALDERFKVNSFYKEVTYVKRSNSVGRSKIEDVNYFINLSYTTIEDIIKDNVRKSQHRRPYLPSASSIKGKRIE